MHRFAAILIGLCLAAAPLRLCADDRDTVKKALEHTLLDSRGPLTEVQHFAEARILHMPRITTREEWEHQANRMRAEAIENVIFRGRAAAWREAPRHVEWLGTLEGGPGYIIKSLRYEAVPGLWIPALLYEPTNLTGKVPVVLNVNGHDRPLGKAAPYKQARCINLAKRGMIALNVEWLGMGQLNGPGYDHGLINAINLCGTSGIAVHYLAMTRGIDLLLEHEHADPDRVAVTGLSGGGWQTIFVSAFDTRVKLCVPVAGYSSYFTRVRHFSDLGDSEQTPCDLGTVTDYAQMTAMLAPRSALLIFNAKDNCCFAADHALEPLLAAAQPVFQLYDLNSNLRAHVNDVPGTHNYDRDNRQALYRMIGEQFSANDPRYDPTELPYEAELKTKQEFTLPLPADNADFHSISLELARDLPRGAELPTETEAADRWRRIHRDRLREIVRSSAQTIRAEKAGSEEHDGLKVAYWKLHAGKEWTIPAVELVKGEARQTAIVVHDGGRKSALDLVSSLLGSGHRVLAVDPFYLGESHIASHESLFALMVDTLGSRPLGLQADQLAAIARWMHSEPGEEVTVVADGRRSCLAALVAATLEEKAISGLELHGSMGSLKEVLEERVTYPQAPELFCFGLLEAFDIKPLVALVAPRPVALIKPSERLRKEAAGLKPWYALLGGHFDIP